MRYRFAMIVLLVMAALTAGSVARADKASDEKAIRALHAKLVDAFRKKDAKDVMALCTEDFKEKGLHGEVMQGAQMEAMLKQQFSMMQGTPKVEMTPSNIKVSGSKATYISAFKMSGKILDTAGMIGPKGKTHTMNGSGKEKVTVVKDAGAWKFKLVEHVAENMTVDGKPFNPAGPTPTKK